MNPLEGIIFLGAGVVVFVAGIIMLLARERSRRRPKRTVAYFRRSRRAMRRIFAEALALRQASWLRARASHPSRERRERVKQERRKSA
jgi:hypothetical protein